MTSASKQPADPSDDEYTASLVAVEPPYDPDESERTSNVVQLPGTGERQYRSEEERQAALRREERQARPQGSALPGPVLVRLDELLAQPDEDTRYRVDRLWPIGGRVVLNAQWKAGKTTTVGNLVRSLVDGDPFLGAYEVTPTGRPVVVFDDELDVRTVRRWYREQGIENTDQVYVCSLRGQLGAFNLLDPTTRAGWVQRLADIGAGVVILDCLSPALSALGLEENSTGEVRRFLAAFDALLVEAGAEEGAIVHHMGHSSERGRGASGLRDWPDAEWNLVREQPDGDRDEPDPSAPRYFKAYGRDVDEPEQRLDYDQHTRRLTVGGGSRRTEKRDRHIPVVVELVAEQPGITRNQLVEALEARGIPQRQAKDAVKRASDADTGPAVRIEAGPNRAHQHYPSPGGSRWVNPLSHHRVVGGSVPIGDPPPPPLPTCSICLDPLDDVEGTGHHPGCVPATLTGESA